MPASVIVRDLRKRYGPVEAVRGISFEVAPGAIFGLIGPNGAGKTTTVECILGLREPDAGAIEVCGIDARRRQRAMKQRVGAALQTTELQDKITPREALGLFASFYTRAATPAELLDRFALRDKADAPFDTLSGGQRQRLALALAFVNTPELVFLDEPTAGLDPQSRRDLHAAITGMQRDGHTVLLTTHTIAEAEHLCDRVAIINHGRIVADGTPRELMARSSASPAVTLTASAALDPALFASIAGVRDVECEGTTVRFHAANVTEAIAALMQILAAHAVEPIELHVQKATLEDVFLELTGTRADEPAE